METRKSGIHLPDLPRTFLDAIIIARLLKLDYLWIDSLCICQDDAEDWARESSLMMSVYSNAHLVIAAGHATDSSVGIFHTRPSRATCKIPLSSYADGDENTASNVYALLLSPSDEYGFYGGDFKTEPLSQRGWAFQERVLARRIGLSQYPVKDIVRTVKNPHAAGC